MRVIKTIDRIMSGLASLGFAVAAYRSVPVLWLIDPMSALLVAMSLALTSLTFAIHAIAGRYP